MPTNLVGIPIEFNLTGENALIQGSRWSKTFALKYRDANGNLVTWTTEGYSGRMHVRADITSAVSVELSTANGRLEVGPDMTVRMTLAATALNNVADFGLGVYDLFLTDTYGVEQKVLFGWVAMQRRVTR